MTMLKWLILKANVIEVFALIPRTFSAFYRPCEDTICIWTGKMLVVGFGEQKSGVDDEIRAAALKILLAFT